MTRLRGVAAALRPEKARGAVDTLPWGTLDPTALPTEVVHAARVSFREGAASEYATAVGFSELTTALLRAGAPHAFVSSAAGFVREEMIHADINARLAAELGTTVDFDTESGAVTFAADPNASPLDQALELAVRVSCVGEALSVPLLTLAMKRSTHPLVHAGLLRIVRDEPHHARIGFLLLDWAKDRLDLERRTRLSEISTREIAKFSDYFDDRSDSDCPAVRAGMREVGFAPAREYIDTVRRALRDRVVVPLAKRGIAADVVRALTPAGRSNAA